MRILCGLVLLALFTPSMVLGAPVSTSEALGRALAQAGPGTRIEIAPGTYPGGLHFVGLRGAEGRPIVLAAADPARPPVFEGGTTGLHLTSPGWVVLEDLVFAGASGNGLNVDDGGSAETPAHDVVFRRLVVRDVGPRGNRDGIKLSGVRDFLVEDCRVLRWGDRGSGIDMVGCHDGTIRGCFFAHGDEAGSHGVQAKGGSTDVAIDACRFEHAGLRALQFGGSTGRPYFRPALAAAEAPFAEARRIHVTNCEILGSQAAVAWASSVECSVTRCTIYRPTRWVARILQEAVAEDFEACRDGRFAHCIVVWRRDDVRRTVNVGPNTAPDTFVFEGNWWFCEDAPGASRPALPVEPKGETVGRDPRLRDPAAGDLHKRRDSPAARRGADRPVPASER